MNIVQAITTKYLPYTNSRPSRIKAEAFARSLTIPYDHSLSTDKNHEAAAVALIEKLGWGGIWYVGGMPHGNGNVYVNAGKSAEFAFETQQRG